MRVHVVLLAAGAMSLGCGSSSEQIGGTLDCAWLEGDNCWKSTAEAAQSCLPSPDATGTFSADNAVCTYQSGQVVTFTPALTYPFESTDTWDFTVTSAGQTCMHYQQTAGGDVTLTVGMDKFLLTRLGPAAVRFTCPDRTTYTSMNTLDFSCPGGSHSGPGTNVNIKMGTSEGASVRFTLQGTSSSSGLPIFYCLKP
jgi:hypothetical protein